jgi:hypothetical protein
MENFVRAHEFNCTVLLLSLLFCTLFDYDPPFEYAGLIINAWLWATAILSVLWIIAVVWRAFTAHVRFASRRHE